ncbi:MAG: 30S ribosome-binding factor RbfA [Candidatus Adiutrix intracellularis]|nr:30S ribosome-binding factor RbfA [Candidatus Adiutrix intracellularis]
MSQRRLEKLNKLLKETIAVLLLNKSKDPRLKVVSVTAVRITRDLKIAVVSYSVLGESGEKVALQKALARAAPFVRSTLAVELGLRYTPEIKFEFDRNLEYAQHMNDLLKRVGSSVAGVSEYD